MSMSETFIAIFLGSKTSPRMMAWNALSEEARHTKAQEGIAAWKAGVKTITLQSLLWAGLSARPKR